MPPGLDLQESRKGTIIGVAVALWCLALLAVALRVLSRRIKGTKLWLDDWLIFAALPFSTTQVFVNVGYGTSKGLGHHLWATPPDSLYAYSIDLFVSQCAFAGVVVCFKLSILALYWRLFHFQRFIKALIWALAMVILLWGALVMLLATLQCNPTRALWARYDPVNPLPRDQYYCRFAERNFLLFTSVPTLVTDIIMLILPIPYIWKLKLPRSKRYGVLATFCLGSFIPAVAIVRIIFIAQGNFVGVDITWNFPLMMLLSVARVNVGILCACLPLILPVLSAINRRVRSRHAPSQRHGAAHAAAQANDGAPWPHTIGSPCGPPCKAWLRSDVSSHDAGSHLDADSSDRRPCRHGSDTIELPPLAATEQSAKR
ncbi:uncharacterized protein UV8b_03378 [Ustilaginoidea virens]|uniref:Rhodopsin domain-containing protein n=1 Tax=Ustilaginoidea virens TaxID=1159556 RepID=A0A8E5HPL2_USTVR|nr:uncharacterized protein UV8b_03378 [Ustilaginoidea virens]QUC19137.1 hypothetical protein UV8b_03378 [Ustilaginoidea virens]